MCRNIQQSVQHVTILITSWGYNIGGALAPPDPLVLMPMTYTVHIFGSKIFKAQLEDKHVISKL